MTLGNNNDYQPGRDGASSLWINHGLAIGTCIVYMVVNQRYKSKYKYEENIKEFLIFPEIFKLWFPEFFSVIIRYGYYTGD